MRSIDTIQEDEDEQASQNASLSFQQKSMMKSAIRQQQLSASSKFNSNSSGQFIVEQNNHDLENNVSFDCAQNMMNGPIKGNLETNKNLMFVFDQIDDDDLSIQKKGTGSFQ